MIWPNKALAGEPSSNGYVLFKTAILQSMNRELEACLESLKKFSRQKEYTSDESFIRLPYDENILETSVAAIKSAGEPELKNIVLIGIGGSSLGTKAVYKALEKSRDNLVKIDFLDQIDPREISKIADRLKKEPPEKSAIVIISKSGSTAEVRTNLSLLQKEISLREGYKIFKISGSKAFENIPGAALEIPKAIGGRFSIFSSVGTVPLGLSGINIVELFNGGMLGTKKSLEEEKGTLIAEISKIFENYNNGKYIYNIFFFNRELYALAEWYRQLIGESLGKESKGIFPSISEGSKDLHSLQQYFVGGMRNVQHEFLSVKGKNSYQEAILKAVLSTYDEEEIPYRNTVLESLDEKCIGEFMQRKMIEIVSLAHIMEINPFGQPDVDSYKKRIKDNLEDVCS